MHESVRRVVVKSFSFAGLNRDGKRGTGLVEGPEELELAEAFKEVNMPVMVKKRKKIFWLGKYRKVDH
jgi:hypothetical protein